MYTESPEQLADARGGAVGRLEDARLILTISRQEKIDVLTKILNPEQAFFNRNQIGSRKTIEKYGYDPFLISAIQVGFIFIRLTFGLEAVLERYLQSMIGKVNWICIGCHQSSIRTM